MTETIQLTVDDEYDLQWLRERAQTTGQSLAEIVREAVRQTRQRQARAALLRDYGEGKVTPEDMLRTLDEWKRVDAVEG